MKPIEETAPFAGSSQDQANERAIREGDRRERRLNKHRRKRVARIVFERDGWLCQICRLPVEASLAGTQDDAAPTVDHIIPASMGGRWTASNLRLAHKLCNEQRHGHHITSRKAPT